MTSIAGAGSLGSLRRINRGRVLRALQERGAASRVELVRATGLSRTAVSSLVADLLREGVVIEQLEAAPRASSPNGGRPATLLTLDPGSGAFVGIDLGHARVRVVVVDRAGTPLAAGQRELDVDHHREEALAAVDELVPELLRSAGTSRDRVLGAGAALSAPMRLESHAFASSRIFPAWAGVDVAETLSQRLGTPVHVGNDANLGALAETILGAGRGVENLLYVLLSAGVGGGLVLDGRVYEGATGTAGELGHVVVEPQGRVCRCGNRGCLETVAGVDALTDALAGHLPDASIDRILERAAAGDPGVTRVLADAGRAVGTALAGLCSVLDPEVVVLGGEIAMAGDVLLDGVSEAVERNTSPAAGRSYTVLGGALGADAQALGGAALAMREAAGVLAASQVAA